MATEKNKTSENNQVTCLSSLAQNYGNVTFSTLQMRGAGFIKCRVYPGCAPEKQDFESIPYGNCITFLSGNFITNYCVFHRRGLPK